VPIVGVPPPFRGPTRGLAEVEVQGATVRECLAAVEARHPGFEELIVDVDGTAQRFVTLFVNGDEIARDALDTAIGAADRVEILTSAAGG
jgi:hypothetical protein